MRATLLVFCALLVFGSAAVAGAPISQDRAHQLAVWYFARYFPRESGGGAALPTLREDYWESTVGIGRAGTPRGTIRVHRYTGRISYRGPFFLKPAVSAQSLERWASTENGTRKP
jgi:hypothetical protein